MYKLILNKITQKIDCVNYQVGNILYSIPFDPANTDYANFRKEILADEAQLQDADGNVMADAKAYVASLP
jgi:hypothetical protein